MRKIEPPIHKSEPTPPQKKQKYFLMNQNETLLNLAEIFSHSGQRIENLRVVSGFDGFVDEMISVVDERKGLSEWAPVKDIASFGSLIKAAAGRSSLREIVIHRHDPGGCSVNLGDGLLALGVPLRNFATLGNPRHPAFDEFASRCKLCVSWGKSYGRTLAFEFQDGKVMLSAVTQLSELDERLLDEVLHDGVFLEECQHAELIAMTNWTLYPHMSACWRKLQRDIYSKLPTHPWIFLDLVDPSSRAKEDIADMLEALKDFEKYGRTILGVNGNEGNIIAGLLGLGKADNTPEAVGAQAAAIRESLGISEVVTHCVKFAAMADASGIYTAQGPYCPSPKKSTGAGDRFNAGYCIAQLLSLSPEQRLLVGNAASGFFVRNARSANSAELASFIRDWSVGNL